MYVCMYVCVYVCVRVSVCVCVYVCMYICVHERMYEMMDEFVKIGKISNYGVSVFTLSEAMSAIKFPNVKNCI